MVHLNLIPLSDQLTIISTMPNPSNTPLKDDVLRGRDLHSRMIKFAEINLKSSPAHRVASLKNLAGCFARELDYLENLMRPI
jgi:hypothetical protein